MYLSRNRVYY